MAKILLIKLALIVAFLLLCRATSTEFESMKADECCDYAHNQGQCTNLCECLYCTEGDFQIKNN